MKRIYVYYRVLPEEAGALRTKLARLLAEVERRTGVRGRLSARYNDPKTWMETYEPVEDAAAFASLLAELAVNSEMDLHLAPGSLRQIECFTDFEEQR